MSWRGRVAPEHAPPACMLRMPDSASLLLAAIWCRCCHTHGWRRASLGMLGRGARWQLGLARVARQAGAGVP